MQNIQIGDKISQIILTDVDQFSKDKLENYQEIDKQKGNILSVVYDNLSSKEHSRYNYYNFINGLEFFLEEYNFEPYPPNTYLSEDIRFLKSTISHYRDNFYGEYLKLTQMNLEQYLEYLENIYKQTDDDQKVRKEMMKEYLVQYISKFCNREDYILFCIASENEFIARGMYLFGILPTLFVRLV